VCSGEVIVELVVDGIVVRNRCLIAPSLVRGADVILGFDVIRKLRGVTFDKDGKVSWHSKMCALAAPISPTASKLRIEDTDFIAVFDGQRWTVEWKWQIGEPQLSNQCA